VSALARLRLSELGLLLLAGLVCLAGAATLILQRGVQLTTTALLPAIAVIALFVAAHFWLVARLPRADQTLLPLAAGLTGLGLTMVTRIEPSLGPRQLVWLAISLPRPIRLLARYRYTCAVVGIALLASTMVLGVDPNGSGVRIWLGYGGYYFQPSELIKVLLVVFLAAYLDEVREMIGASSFGVLRSSTVAYLLPVAVMCGACLLLMLAQRDLGPAVLFFGLTLAMLYLATDRALYAFGGALAFTGGMFVVYRLFSVARLRIDIWLNPWAEMNDRGYQVVQGLMALANGGVFGTGIGWGHPEILPAAHTDFPFAVIGEELGIVGAAAIVGLYAVLSLRGYALAARASSSFASLLAAGLATVISFQALIILGGNLKLLPLTGITLPFVSYGGSSLLTNFLILGLLHRISAEEIRS
jgi:cell division protein FtsW (lipid II flippase)